MPVKSEKQRKMMGAVCSGKKPKKGNISKETACEILHGKKKKGKKK